MGHPADASGDTVGGAPSQLDGCVGTVEKLPHHFPLAQSRAPMIRPTLYFGKSNGLLGAKNLDSISYEELTDLIDTFRREALHLEMRDSYGTAAELPHLAKWEAGEPDDPGWLQPWFDRVTAATQVGKVFRRARIISEPVSTYQKWVLNDSHRFVDAGEDIRWVPRDRVSTVALPGNDFWLFDDQTVVFLIFAGNGLVMDRQKTNDRAAIEFCRDAFEAVWKLSIPNGEYHAD
jgi:hypothetical protein